MAGVFAVALVAAPFAGTTGNRQVVASGSADVTLAPTTSTSTTSTTTSSTSTSTTTVARTTAAPATTRATTPRPTTIPTVGATPPAAAPATGCHPSYAGACVPIASDVDCGGGSGNGPAYVYQKNFRVVGPDVYGLDSDGDGIACES